MNHRTISDATTSAMAYLALASAVFTLGVLVGALL